MRNLEFHLRLVFAWASLVGGASLTADARAAEEAPASDDFGRIANISESIRLVPADLKRIFSYPFDEPADFGRYALGVGLLIALDKPLTRAVQDHVGVPLSGFRVQDAPDPFRKLGTGSTDGWLALGIAASYVGGLVLDDDRSQRAALAATKSVAYSLAISQVLLKSIAGRKRPLDSLSQGSSSDGGLFTSHPLDFGHSHLITGSTRQASSFPSLHFTLWFAVAKVFAVAYDNDVVPYSIATVGLASNIQSHHHWVSDMTAGALIGTLIGSVTARGMFDDNKKVRLSAAWTGGGPTVWVAYRF